MKILVTSDNHIQRGARWDECCRIHEFMLERAAAMQADLFLDGGDIYDAASTPEERIYATSFYQRMAECRTVVIVGGNHERAKDIAIFRQIRSRNPIYVIEDHEVILLGTGSDSVAIGGLAWPRLAATAAKTVHSHAAAVRDEVRRRLEGLREGFEAAPGATRILLAHLMMEGASVGAGQPLRGRDSNATWTDLLLAEPHVALLGHVHRPDERTVGDVPVITIGSPYRTDFGELEPKSLVVLETGDGPVKISRIPTPATPMLLLDAALEGDAFRVNYKAAELVGPQGTQGAEVRVEYLFDPARRDEARRLAEEEAERMRAAGAVSVDLKPVPRITSTARAPQVATAVTMVEKVRVMWDAKGLTPTDDGRLTDFVRLLDEQVGAASKASQGAFRFLSLEVAGFISFPEKVVLDLEHMSEKLLAVMGANGEGKTVLLGMLMGAVYRSVPGDRGPLSELAVSRDAYVELRFDLGGKIYRIRQVVDAKTGTGKTFIYDVAGELVQKETSVTAGDRWIAEHLPPEEVVLASVFAAQGEDPLITMPEADRRKVVLRAIGIERIEKMAAAARKNAETASEQVRVISARIDDERARGGDPLVLQENLASSQVAAQAADEREAIQRRALAEAEAAAADDAARLQAYERRKAEAQDLTRRASTAAAAAAAKGTQVADTDRQCRGFERALVEARALRDRASDVEAATKRHGELDAQVRQFEQEVAGITAQVQALTADLTRTDGDLRTRSATVDQAGVRIQQLRSKLAELATAAALAETLPALSERLASFTVELEAKDAEIQEAAGQIDALSSQRLLGATDRIDGLRGGLTKIAQGHPDPAQTADLTLAADDAAVQSAQDVPVQLERARLRHREATQARRVVAAQVATWTAQVSEAQRAAGRMAERAQIEELLAQAQTDLVGHESALREATEAKADAQRKMDEAKARRREIEAQIGKIRYEQSSLEPTLTLAASVAAAGTRIEETTGRLQDALATLERLRAEAQGLTQEAEDLRRRAAEADPGAAPTSQDLDPIRQRAAAAASAARDAHARVAVAQAAIESSRESAARHAALVDERSRHEADVADWNRVAQDLGRNGLQSLEIDAAGPRISEIANQLLRGTYGTRYTVRIATTRPDDSGKRQIECLDIMVYDAKDGLEKPAKRLSGGQRIVIGEAVSLALAVFACDRAGATNCTLVRDENGAPLDPEAAVAYVDMLREVVRLVSADKVLLVTHSPAVQEMADVRLVVQGGTVVVA